MENKILTTPKALQEIESAGKKRNRNELTPEQIEANKKFREDLLSEETNTIDESYTQDSSLIKTDKKEIDTSKME